MDRNQYEKQALAYLSRGNNDKALAIYAQMLRADPRDRRIRQKLADLYLKMGRRDEAEKQYREVVRLYQEDGNHRAAISVLTQLRRLKPQDAELIGLLGETYHAAGKPIEAEKLLDQAVKALQTSRPEMAANFITTLMLYRHGDISLQIKRAELLESAKKVQPAYEAYREVIEELRRRGKLMEVGRVAVAALRIKPGMDDLLQDAAEAALAQGEIQTALRYLQQAFQKNNQDPRTLDLLARSFESAESPAKARHVLGQLAEVLARRGDHAGRLSALERAIAQGGGPDIQARAEKARAALEASAFRLHELEGAAPKDEAELRVCTRAEVFIRYGFPDRAGPEVQAAMAASPQSPALLAAAAEVAAAREDSDAAIKWSRALLRVIAGPERAKVELRLAVLEGRDPSTVVAAPQAPEPDDLLDDDDDLLDGGLLDDESVESPEPAPLLDDDLLDDEDDFLDDDPLDDDPFAGDDEDEDDEPQSSDLISDVFQSGGTFAEADPSQFSVPDGPADPEEDDRARGLLLLGMNDDARITVAGRDDLTAAALRARSCAAGKEEDALTTLRNAFDTHGVSDPGAADALFAMALLNARMRKPKIALRFLDLLERQSPGWRELDVKECRLALKHLSE